jgi:hypothetical protein
MAEMEEADLQPTRTAEEPKKVPEVEPPEAEMPVLGECRRFPPQLQEDGMSEFPLTPDDGDYGCWEFRKKDKSSNTGKVCGPCACWHSVDPDEYEIAIPVITEGAEDEVPKKE